MRNNVLVSLALATAMTVSAAADDRRFMKYHETIKMDEERFGEYTTITASDERSPSLTKLLYQDAVGERLVILVETDYVSDRSGGITGLNSAHLSVTSVRTHEQVSVDHHGDGTLTLVVDGASLRFKDVLPPSEETRRSAVELLEKNASAEFIDALHRLARVGSYYALPLETVGNSLRDLFFPDIDTIRAANYTTEPTETVEGFDPYRHPPGAFEKPFGSAYYNKGRPGGGPSVVFQEPTRGKR